MHSNFTRVQTQIEKRPLLSTLWIFVLLNIIVRDLHQFLNPTAFQEMMEMNFSEGQVLLFAFILEIPIAMVLLSRVLPDTANKWTNVIAAVINLMGIVSTLPTADLDDFFFAGMESMALIAIVVFSFKQFSSAAISSGR